ncbi:isochorismatase family protein [Chloroflexota bacterium]|nr:isochorismatase family protein [Chloroflexota bacterium]
MALNESAEEMMATIREGNRTALLIVDMQVHVIDSAWKEGTVIENTRLALKKARERGIPVIWIQHVNQKLVPGSSGWQIIPPLEPLPNEIQIEKHFNSAFEETDLENTLARLNITHIVLAGVLTNWCIQSTAYAALDKGYDLTLIEDAHTTDDFELDNGETIKATQIIQAFNITIGGLRYPGRTNRVISVDELAF